MKEDKGFEINNNIDNEFLEEGENYAKKKTYKWAAIVAWFALTIIIVTLNNSNRNITNLKLSMLTLESPAIVYGFEGYMAYSIDDLTNANPWNETMDITHLPVIKNTLSYNGSFN
ncbi:hypothetical protein [Anaerotignum sp.]|uniref:hypothetical protein n=1 Tax=Anaerotignum sp. TaxID=2039241 RepID=UPI002714D2DE|nr:hypothetical protein [Anaerotignum sp.]